MGELCKKKLLTVRSSADTRRVEAAIEDYGLTSALLYNLSQHGFAPDLMRFGMNVVMDAINFAAAVIDDDKTEKAEGYTVKDMGAAPVAYKEA